MSFWHPSVRLAQTECFVVFFVHLFRELLLTQLVKSEELASQLHVVYEPTTGQLHPDDDLTIGNHHGHGAEIDLQVFRKLLPTCIPWILSGKSCIDKDACTQTQREIKKVLIITKEHCITMHHCELLQTT